MINEENIKNVLNVVKGDNQFIRTLELDDTIKFGCKCCGNCCSNREDIILTPYDIYRLAKALNEKPIGVIQKYCKVHLGTNSCLPTVVLKEDERKLCPFLKYDVSQNRFGCSINNSKPGSCILHPIGVVRSFDLNGKMEDKKFFEIQSCPNHDTTTEIKVRDFIQSYLDHEKEFDISYEIISLTSNYVNARKFVKAVINQNEEYISKNNLTEEMSKIKNLMDDFIKDMVYKTYIVTTLEVMFDFDMNRDFLEQIDDVKNKIIDNALKLIATFDGLGIDLKAKELTEEETERLDAIREEFDAQCEALVQEMKNNIEEKEEKND